MSLVCRFYVVSMSLSNLKFKANLLIIEYFR